MKKNPTPRPATYAIFGMMEFTVTLPVANRSMTLNFTGGHMSGYGIRPATFTTSDPILKGMIEALPDFKSGRIKRL